MRIAVLASPESWYLRDLQRAAAGRHEVAPVGYRELAAAVRPGGTDILAAGGRQLSEFDAVVVRTMPPGSTEQIVFRMDLLGELARQGTPVVNPPRAIEAAVDKFLCSARLAAAGVPQPRTIAAQTVSAGLAAFAELGGDVVLKPLFGSEGRGIARLTDPAVAERIFGLLTQLGAVLYLQEFVPHGDCDYRVLLIGRMAWCVRRRNPHDWRTNLSRGATAEPCDLPDEWLILARRAAEAVGAPLAGVDLMIGPDERPLVIEVNAVPGWRGLAAALNVDIAAEVLAYLEQVSAEGVGRLWR